MALTAVAVTILFLVWTAPATTQSNKPPCNRVFKHECQITYYQNVNEARREYCEYWYGTTATKDEGTNAAKDEESYIAFQDYKDLLKLDAVAQEGRSYCIVPEHIRNSGKRDFLRNKLRNWDRFKKIQPLLNINLDIGTHINPNDYSKMNAHAKEFTDKVFCGDDTMHKGRPAIFSDQPDLKCINPYKIKVTEIKANGLRMQNWLHIKIYTDLLPKSQRELKNCPTGKIKYLLLEVRDQAGLPVGVFTDEIPCDSSSNKKTDEKTPCPEELICNKYVATQEDRIPCMFDPLRSIMHPEILFVSSTSSQTKGGGGNIANGGSAAGDTVEYFTEIHATWKFAQHTSSFVSQLHFAALIIEDEKALQYFTSRRIKIGSEEYCHRDYSHDLAKYYEYRIRFMHGNWRYELSYCCHQLNCGGTQEIFRHGKNVKLWVNRCGCPSGPSVGNPGCTEWRYTEQTIVPNNPNPTQKSGIGAPGMVANEFRNVCFMTSNTTTRPYGYTAQYTMLKPTLKTLGAPDFYRKKYIKVSQVDCHVKIEDDTFYASGPNLKGKIPVNAAAIATLKPALDRDYARGLTKESKGTAYEATISRVLNDRYPKIPTKYSEISDATDDRQPATTYFGTKYTKFAYSSDYERFQGEMNTEYQQYPAFPTLASKERCPCPKLPTTVPPEIATRPPMELDGRRSHAVQMLIAWVILVPLSIFSARYFKETYSKVFFLQEFWWYAVHVLCSFTAFVFMLGGIYALEVKKSAGGVWVQASLIHIVLGSVTMGVYFMHLCLGFVRAYDVQLRMIQIVLHWMFGWLEYIVAVTTILITASMPQGFMPCEAMYLYYGFLGFQAIVIIGMEIQMQIVDGKLKLNPKRSYLPPPVMRLFHMNAPWSSFRMFVLFGYALVCLGVYGGLHYLISLEGNEFSCMQQTEVAREEEEF